MANPSGSSESSGANKRFSLGRLRRSLGWLVLLVVILYGASNLWLSSGWGTGLAENKLKERTGLDCEVGSMTWSPWNGFTINDVRMLQPEELRAELPEPVVLVDRIRVKPYWTQLLRGRTRPKEVSVDSPELTISVEMLAALASQISPSKVVPPPAKLAPQPVPKTPDQPTPREAIKKTNNPKIGQTQPTAPVEKDRPAAGLPMWLKVNNATIRIVSVSKDIELLRAERLTLDMPVFGEDATGVIKVAVIKIPGLPELVDLEQRIVWKRPYLELEEQTVDVDGLKMHYIGQLGVGRDAMRRLPFLFDLAIDSQKLESVKWFERLALDVSAEKLTGRFRVNGSLSSPMSWRTDMMVEAVNLGVKEIHGSHDVVFDEVYIPAVFRQGQLRWNGIRFIGEDISVLGNGRVSVADGVLCVIRLVASPEVAQMLTRGLRGSGLADYKSRWWENLDTPDRKFRDLLVSGNLTDPVVDAGHLNANLPVWQIVVSTLNFIREEMKEEGKELAPLPNKDLLNKKKHENH